MRSRSARLNRLLLRLSRNCDWPVTGEPVGHEPAHQNQDHDQGLPGHDRLMIHRSLDESLSSQEERLGLYQSDHSKATVVNVPATFNERTAKSRTGRDSSPLAGAARAAAASIELDVDQDQGPQDAPEQGVGNREAPASAQPVPLVGMQEPGGEEDGQRCPGQVPAVGATA